MESLSQETNERPQPWPVNAESGDNFAVRTMDVLEPAATLPKHVGRVMLTDAQLALYDHFDNLPNHPGFGD